MLFQCSSCRISYPDETLSAAGDGIGAKLEMRRELGIASVSVDMACNPGIAEARARPSARGLGLDTGRGSIGRAEARGQVAAVEPGSPVMAVGIGVTG